MKNLHKLLTPSRLLLSTAFLVSLSFVTWRALLNNFTVEIAHFTSDQIGLLQSLREVPGLLVFSVLGFLLIISQQRLLFIALFFTGSGVVLTGLLPSALGLYIATIIMSTGFHYQETLVQSLALIWTSKKEAPILLGKIEAIKAIAGLISFLLVYILLKYFFLEYKNIYLLFGGITASGSFCLWILFPHFKSKYEQNKKLFLKKRYWLFYILTMLSGARRQIFVVFVPFLLVSKFNIQVENMVALMAFTSILNAYISPKIGRTIVKYGEALTLKIEYLGLIFLFLTYAFVENIYLALALYIIDHLFYAMKFSLKTYFQKIADKADITATESISFSINHIMAVILPASLGIVWLHSVSFVFIIGASIAGTSLLFAFLIPKNPQKDQETIFKTIT